MRRWIDREGLYTREIDRLIGWCISTYGKCDQRNTSHEQKVEVFDSLDDWQRLCVRLVLFGRMPLDVKQSSEEGFLNDRLAENRLARALEAVA